MTVHSLTIDALRQGFRSGQIDPVGLTEELLTRIESSNPSLHTFITVARERALSDARASRERWLSGRTIGPLDGIPLAIKDNIDVAGLPCTGGSHALRERIPLRDAPVAARLKAAGAILLGKLNMHEGALGATTDNEAFGRCVNPLHPGHTPGGSSGGSGAAVAADQCSVAIGSDTMGSIRVPASYCGVFGYKPSNDAVPADGMIPLCHTLDVAGPLGQTAEDCARVARVLMGRTQSSDRQISAWRSVRGLAIGIPKQLDATALRPEVAAGFDQFVAALRADGATLRTIDLTHWDPTRARRAGLLASEADALAWWSNEIGVELPGVSAAFAAMMRFSERAGVEKVSAARQCLRELREQASSAFAGIDLIAMPTTPHASFPHTEPAPIDQADLTTLANVYGCGAWAIPVEAQNRAVSMQLMAAPGRDEWLLALASALDVMGTRSRRFPYARRLEV